MPERFYDPANADQSTSSQPESRGSLYEMPTSTRFVTLSETKPPSVTFQDIDMDGDLDIRITNPAPGQPKWLINTIGNNADTIFKHHLFERITPIAMAVGDIDGDGTNDVVIGHMSGAKIFYNPGEWIMKDLGAVLHTPRTIILDDVNQDGYVDILIRDSENLTLFPNHGGVIGAHSMTWPKLGDHHLLETGNFDLTTREKEILVYNAQSKQLGIIAHNGTTWKSLQTIPSITNVSRIVVTDVNDDGVDDIYVVESEGRLILLESNGEGDISPASDTTLNNSLEPTPAGADSEKNTGSCEKECEMSSSDARGLSDDGFHPSPPAPEFIPEPPPSLEHGSNEEQPPPLEEAAPDTEAPSPESIFPTFEEEPVEVVGSDENDFIFAGNAHEHISGLNGNDVIFANGGDDSISGGRGSDLIFGEDGNDAINGNQDGDILFGGNGDDSIHGGRGDDILFGDLDNDTLVGCEGNDLLFGDRGNDLLVGGLGSDVILGGSGSDTFHYSSAKEGNDEIYDFLKGTDILEFEFGTGTVYNASELPEGTVGEGFIWQETGTLSGRLYYDPDLTVAGNESLIAEIQLDGGDNDITAEDIHIV